MKKSILLAIGLASVALVGCVDFKSKSNSLSDKLFWDSNASSIKLDVSSVPGIITATSSTQSTATTLSVILSGSATENTSCMSAIFPQQSDGNDRNDGLSPNETSFTTYVDGGTNGATYLYEILYFSPVSNCNGLTLNTNIKFTINASQYNASFTHTF